MKVSFVRTKSEELKKVKFGDLKPGDGFKIHANGNSLQKVIYCKGCEGFINQDFVFTSVSQDGLFYPVSQPEPPKPSWDDFRYGCVAKALDNYNREVIIHYAFHGERVFYRDGQGATWDTRTAHKSYTLLELYPPGSGYLKIEI